MFNFRMKRKPEKWQTVIYLAAALAGLTVKGLIVMEAGQRAVFITALIFTALAVPCFQRYSAQERKQALLLAGYEEKRELYQSLLESLFTTLEEVRQGGRSYSRELALTDFLREEKAEFYTCASPRVISAADTFLREARAVSAAGRHHQKVLPLAGEKGLYRLSLLLIKAVQEDLGEEEWQLTGEGMLKLLTPRPCGGGSPLRLYR